MLYIYLDTHFRFLEPLTKGSWPKNMQILATTATPDYPNGRVLPKFSIEQQKKLISSYDFLGINYYSASFAKYQEPSNEIPQGYSTDCHFKQLGINWNCLDCFQNIMFVYECKCILFSNVLVQDPKGYYVGEPVRLLLLELSKHYRY